MGRHYTDDIYVDYIMHHGVKGMHWGEHLSYVLAKATHNTRKQKMLESIASQRVAYKKSRKRGTTIKVATHPIKTLSTAEKRKAALKKAQATRAANAEKKKHIEEIIRTGNAVEAKKFANDMTNDQMKALFDRIDNKAKLSKYASDAQQAKAKAFFDRLDTTADRIGTATKFVNKGIGAYNTGANIYNAVTKSGKKAPIINIKGENDKKQNNDNQNGKKQNNDNQNGKKQNDSNKEKKASYDEALKFAEEILKTKNRKKLPVLR